MQHSPDLPDGEFVYIDMVLVLQLFSFKYGVLGSVKLTRGDVHV